jgi:selenoprotein W-related protein
MAEGSGVKVTITYCAECGYEPQTLALAETLMKTFTHQLTAIELVPWYEGSFDVAVNGRLVHSMYREGGFPEPSTVVNAVKEQLATSSTTS